MFKKYPRLENALICCGMVSLFTVLLSFFLPEKISLRLLQAMILAVVPSSFFGGLCFKNGVTVAALWLRRIISLYVTMSVYAAFLIVMDVVPRERILHYLLSVAIITPVLGAIAFAAVDLYQRRAIRRINDKLKENDENHTR